MKLTGKLVRAGTMTVSGEELTGVFVACSPEQIRDIPHLPMYEDVIIEAHSPRVFGEPADDEFEPRDHNDADGIQTMRDQG